MKSVRAVEVYGETEAPPSKSVAIRAIAAAVLSEGRTVINHPGDCDDVRAARAVAERLGCRVEGDGARLVVTPERRIRSATIDCGESGLCMRLFSAICAHRGGPFLLEGGEALSRRPMEMVCRALEAFGAACSSGGGHPPIRVRGPLVAGSARVDASASSQHVSGLLFALPLCDGESRLELESTSSRPYLDLTVEMLEAFGIKTGQPAPDVFAIPGNQRYRRGVVVDVEGDWSAAAFLLVAGTLAGSVSVSGLRPGSRQADRKVTEALRASGADVVEKEGRVVASKAASLRAFEFDARHCPDLFPPLAALAARCSGKSRLHGAGRLRGKESDRARALQLELGRMGIAIEIEGDTMIVRGGGIKPARVHSHGDHRIAMAAAVAALGTGVRVEIEQEQAIAKSYPRFFDDLARLGVEIS